MAFIITSRSDLTEFESAVQEIFYKGRKDNIDLLKITSNTLLMVARKQMMKDAVEAVSCTFSNSSSTFLRIEDGLDTKDGDKVKLIIIKEDKDE